MSIKEDEKLYICSKADSKCLKKCRHGKPHRKIISIAPSIICTGWVHVVNMLRRLGVLVLLLLIIGIKIISRQS